MSVFGVWFLIKLCPKHVEWIGIHSSKKFKLLWFGGTSKHTSWIWLSTKNTIQAFISDLHWCSLWQLLLVQNILEQVVFSILGPWILSCSSGMLCECRGDWSGISPSGFSRDGHGSSLHVQEGIVTEGKGLQETGQKRSEETEETRFLRYSDREDVGGWSGSQAWSMHGVHSPRVRFSLSSLGGEPGNLMKETMPCRQRGHGMEPGGPIISDVILLVEQR